MSSQRLPLNIKSIITVTTIALLLDFFPINIILKIIIWGQHFICQCAEWLLHNGIWMKKHRESPYTSPYCSCSFLTNLLKFSPGGLGQQWSWQCYLQIHHKRHQCCSLCTLSATLAFRFPIDPQPLRMALCSILRSICLCSWLMWLMILLERCL